MESLSAEWVVAPQLLTAAPPMCSADVLVELNMAPEWEASTWLSVGNGIYQSEQISAKAEVRTDLKMSIHNVQIINSITNSLKSH